MKKEFHRPQYASFARCLCAHLSGFLRTGQGEALSSAEASRCESFVTEHRYAALYDNLRNIGKRRTVSEENDIILPLSECWSVVSLFSLGLGVYRVDSRRFV